MKFIQLIYVKMPPSVGILTFISMIKTTPDRFKARTFFICMYFSFNEHLKFVHSRVEHEKSFITSGLSSGLLTRSCSNQPVQLQRLARMLNICMKQV